MIRLLIILVLVCAGPTGLAQTGIITTIAGCDTSRFSGDGGIADTSCLNFPYCVFKVSNNLFIADALNNRIRKIDLNTNIITTIAGTGDFSYSGDGGPATNAALFLPSGIFIDSNNNLYIADAGNHRIRKIDGSTGIISTVGGSGSPGYSGDGSLATEAMLNGPSGVYVTHNEDIYISEYYNNCIRKIDHSSGIITTIAGTGTSGYSGDNGPAVNALLSAPMNLYGDLDGNIVFVDSWNSVIRKIDLNTGVISRVAGTGVNGYSGDGGLATDANIRVPTGLFINRQGDTYFTEYYSGNVRRIDASTGFITTVVGYGVEGFAGDGGPASNAQLRADYVYVDDNSDMYIADAGNNKIRKVTHPLAVPNVDAYQRFKLAPNPTTGIFTIEGNVSSDLRIEVVNSIGQIAYSNKSVASKQPIDLSFLPSGIYFIQARDSLTTFTEKLIIQH